MQTNLYLTIAARLAPIESLHHAIWSLVPKHFTGTIQRVTYIAPTAPDAVWKAEMIIAVTHETGEDPEEAEDTIVECAQGDIRAVELSGTVSVTLDEVTTGLAI